MITIKSFSKLFIICLITVLLSGNILKVSAQESLLVAGDERVELIFAVDYSSSMKKIDKNYMVYDFIEVMSAAVPSHCKVGAVVYADDVVASIQPGESITEIRKGLSEAAYKGYSNAGAGLTEAVGLFSENATSKRIVLLSDGEIMMDKEEKTLESVRMFDSAVQNAVAEGVTVDVVTFGETIAEGGTVYHAADETGGSVYSLSAGEDLPKFAGQFLFDTCGFASSSIGRLGGMSGEFTIDLPDLYMDRVKIILTGRQESENTVIRCEAEKMSVESGKGFTVIKLEKPMSKQVTVTMASGENMDIYGYLTAEYTVIPVMQERYDVETGEAKVVLDIQNGRGESLLTGHLSQVILPVLVNGKEIEGEQKQDGIYVDLPMMESGTVSMEAKLEGLYGSYYGTAAADIEVTVPVIEKEEPPIDWFLLSLAVVFLLGSTLIFLLLGRRKRYGKAYMKHVDRRIELPEEGRPLKKEFGGKILIYVIRNKEGIDYPPESINLFARCRRDTITLQWLLDTCTIPLEPEGADKIIFRAGDDRALFVKNNSRATAIKGREVMLKSHQYPVFYHEKITFIFDREDTELEIHYRDLK